jgi:hypothetical protein
MGVTTFNSIPEDIEYIWVTHLPDFSINKFKVESITHANNGDVLIKLIDSSIWGGVIRAKKGGHSSKTWWIMKKSYHLTETEAALRLRAHYRELNADNIPVVTSKVFSDARNKELTLANIEKYILNYPEMTI